MAIDADIVKTENSLRRVKRVCRVLDIMLKVALALFCIFWIVSLILTIASIVSPAEHSSSSSMGFLLLAKQLIIGTLTASLLLIAGRIFSEISKGRSPFDIIQVKRMRLISLIFLLFVALEILFTPGLISVALGSSFDLFYTSEVSGDGNIIPVNLGSLFTSAVFFCLSYVFEYGVLLQKLSDETV